MKIKLKALGVLWSKEMDIPDNSTSRWKMVLTQPIQAISGYSGDKIGEFGPIATVCEFEWIGMYEGDAKVYVLRDIIKQP